MKYFLFAFTYLLFSAALAQNNSEVLLVIPSGHTGVISKLNLSYNEKLVSSYGYEEGLSKLWDVQTGKQLEINTGNKDINYFRSYERTPGGNFIAISTLDGIDLFDLRSNSIKLHIKDSSQVFYSLDESRLLVREDYGEPIRIYSTEDFSLVREIANFPTDLVLAFLKAYDSKNEVLYVGNTNYSGEGAQEQLAIYDLTTKALHFIPVQGTGLDAERFFAWGVESGILVSEQFYYEDESYSLLRFYDRESGEKINEIRFDETIEDVATTEKEDYLWVKTYTYLGWSEKEERVHLYDLKSQSELENLALYDFDITYPDYSNKYFSTKDWIRFAEKFAYHDRAQRYYVTCPDIPSLKAQLSFSALDEIEYGSYLEVRSILTDTVVATIQLNKDIRYYASVFLKDASQVLVAYENQLALFNTFTGELIKEFQSNSENLTAVTADSLEQTIAMASKQGNIHLFKKDSNKFSTIKVSDKTINDLLLQDSILYSAGNNSLYAWNTNTSELLVDFSNNGNNWIGFAQNLQLIKAKDRWLLKTSEDFLYDDIITEDNLYDAATGEKVLNCINIISLTPSYALFKGYDTTIYYYLYGDSSVALSHKLKKAPYDFYDADELLASADGKFIVSIYQNQMIIWDFEQGKKIKQLKFPELANYYDYQFDKSGRYLFFGDYKNGYQVELASGKVLKKWKEVVEVNLFDPYVVLKRNSGPTNIEIVDIATGKSLASLKENATIIDYNAAKKNFLMKEWSTNRILFYDLSQGKVVATNSNSLDILKEKSRFFDHTTSVLNYQKGNVFAINANEVLKFDLYDDALQCRMVPLGENRNINVLPSGYYQASQDAAKSLHYVTKDLKIITFDQLDLRYNRPDKVLTVLESEDSLLIQSYQRAYQKRLQKMGVDTSAFRSSYALPEIDFVNRASISEETHESSLTLTIKGEDKAFTLDRFNVWVNEVPLFGSRGISLKNRKIQGIDTTITIALSAGTNRIETSIVNSNQIESYRMPLYVKYTGEKAENVADNAHTYFIGIGIDHFAAPNHDLSYSVKDVRDLSKALKEKLGKQITIDTLFNENVSLANVQALKAKLMKTSIHDKVIISYSGHGLLNADLDYFLSAYTVDFLSPENGGIPYEVMEDLLDGIPARKKLLLIDACHSGEVDKEEFQSMNMIAGAKGLVTYRGGETENTGEPRIGLENSFQLMQELFVNVQKGSGATIISAAGGDQFALEGGNLQNGYFTHAILEFMKANKEGNINALKKYVFEEVQTLSGGLQKPTSRVENLEMDWRVW